MPFTKQLQKWTKQNVIIRAFGNSTKRKRRLFSFSGNKNGKRKSNVKLYSNPENQTTAALKYYCKYQIRECFKKLSTKNIKTTAGPLWTAQIDLKHVCQQLILSDEKSRHCRLVITGGNTNVYYNFKKTRGVLEKIDKTLGYKTPVSLIDIIFKTRSSKRQILLDASWKKVVGNVTRRKKICKGKTNVS